MQVVITGGAGFLGRWLVDALRARGRLAGPDGVPRAIRRIVTVDQVEADPGHGPGAIPVQHLVGDVSDRATIAAALAAGANEAVSVFHLAAVVSGAAEADLDLGLRVNLDGTRAWLDACRALAAPPRVVFASSVAVFGGALPEVVSDATAPTPQSSYGVQKLAGELLVGDYARRGLIDGRAVRLPTIVVRPGKPNAAASSFASGIIREPLAGLPAVCPVDPDTPMWLLSPARAIDALIHAHEVETTRWREDTRGQGLNLPGLTVRVAAMLDALAAVGGAAARARVRFEPDARIRAIVAGWPARFDTGRANALGFTADADFHAVVRAHAAAFPPAGDPR